MTKSETLQLIISAKDAASAEVRQVSNAVNTMQGNVKNLLGGLLNLKTAFAGIGASLVVRDLLQAVDAFEKTENSLRGLAGVARYAGQDMGKSIQAASDLSADGLINVGEASKALQNLLNRGFDLEQSITMLERLKDSAAFNRQAHLSMGAAVVAATEGLKNENSTLVDNAGVTKNVSVMWREYAAIIGKTADTLSQAEKRQAEFAGIMRETEGQVGNAKLAIDGITGAKARLTTEVYKLRTAMGDGLVPTFMLITKAISASLGYVKMFIGGIEILGAATAWIIEKGKVFWTWMVQGGPGGIQRLKEQFALLDRVYDEQAEEIVRKWEGKIKMPLLGPDTGKRRSDVEAVEDRKKIAKDWESLEKKLAIELVKIDGDKWDVMLAQAKQHYDEEVELAHGRADLLKKIELAYAGAVAQINADREKDAEKTRMKELDAFLDDVDRRWKAEVDHHNQLGQLAMVDMNEANERYLSEEQRERILQDLKLRIRKAASDDLSNQHAVELAELDQRHAQEIDRLRSFHATKAEIEDAYRLQQQEKNQLMADQEYRLMQGRLSLASQVAGSMADAFKAAYDATGKRHKSFYQAYKATAITQTIIDTYSSAVAAFKAMAGIPYVGPILGGIAAAAAVATGMMKVAAIRAQQFAAGGLVKIGSGIRDDVPAILTKGEYVIRRQAVNAVGAAALDRLNSMGGGVRKFAEGGMVGTGTMKQQSQNPEKVEFTQAIFLDPGEFERFMATTRGKNAILSVISSRAGIIKRILR